MEKTNQSRAIDTSGRIIIPKSIRAKYNLEVGSELEFFLDGEKIIMVPKLTDSERDIEWAKTLLERNGWGLAPPVKKKMPF